MSRIDYDLSMIRGVVFDMDGVLSPSTVNVREDGTLERHSNVKDGYAIQYALRRGLHLAVISGARDLTMEPAYKSLGIKDVYFHCGHKVATLYSWMEKHGLAPEEVAFIGDDIPDIKAMMEVGLRVTPADGAVEVKGIATYISPVKGGQGVARDLISQILSAKGEWLLDDAYDW